MLVFSVMSAAIAGLIRQTMTGIVLALAAPLALIVIVSGVGMFSAIAERRRRQSKPPRLP